MMFALPRDYLSAYLARVTMAGAVAVAVLGAANAQAQDILLSHAPDR